MHLVSKIIASAALLLLVVIGLIVTDTLQYRINITPSMPRGLYRKTDKMLYRGAIVAECLPLEQAELGKKRGWLQHGKCPGNVMSVMKEVFGLPGDTVELANEYVAVNDTLIFETETRETDSQGRPLPAYPRGVFVLQPGQVFLLATRKANSWDSRNIGPVQESNVIATLQPVWVEGK